MHCEFCDVTINSLALARRHILSTSHMRARRNHGLSVNKSKDKMRQASIHPKDMYELMKLINVHSRQDVRALEDMDFFSVQTKIDNRIVREITRILYESVRRFYLKNLPPELVKPLTSSFKRVYKIEE